MKFQANVPKVAVIVDFVSIAQLLRDTDRRYHDQVMRLFSPVILVAAALLLGVQPLQAQTGANILVVANGESATSVRIAEYYAGHRSVPAEQILRLKGLTADPPDGMAREMYDGLIEAPVAAWLTQHSAQDRVHYIVLAKGIPLRINGSTGRTGTVASVDSELTLLYQRMSGVTTQLPGGLPNPYFLEDRPLAQAQPFSHERVPLYLVTRLDGFSVDDVLKLVDRGVAPVTAGRVVLDQRASWTAVGNQWLKDAADRLVEIGFGNRVLLESTSKVVTNEASILGYYSWGSNDPAIKQRDFGLGFVPGALAAMFVSFDGRTFREPPATWNIGIWEDRDTYFAGAPQSLAGDLIRAGASGVAGHVAEPFLDATIRPQILFPVYFKGMNLAESFYLAMPDVSWATVVVGDPLCAPFRTAAQSGVSLDPGIDPDTELPRWFSARAVATFSGRGLDVAGVKHYLRGQARLAHGDRPGGVAELKASVAAEPRLVEARSPLAGYFEGEKDFAAANTQYLAILDVKPGDVIALNNLAFNLADRLGKPQEGLQYAQRAYTLAGRASAIADTLGWVYHLLGDDKQAITLLGPAADADVKNADIQVHAARVFMAAGRPEPARKYLDRALALQPDLAQSPDVEALKAALK